jgi:hypothetical protein
LHLIADVYTDSAYAMLAAQPLLRRGDVRMLPRLTEEERERLVTGAERMARLGFTDSAERGLLSAFFDYAMPEGTAYNLTAKLHRLRGDTERATWWQNSAAQLLARPVEEGQ